MLTVARALETRPLQLTRHRRPTPFPRDRASQIVRDLMLRRWTRPPWTKRKPPSKAFMAFAWNGIGSPSARPARKTSLFGKSALEADRDEKARSVVALSRVPRLAGFAGSPPAVGPFFRRLTGLLSGSPPTDTRPQARAKLGNRKICRFVANTRAFFQKTHARQPQKSWRSRRGLGKRDRAGNSGRRPDGAVRRGCAIDNSKINALFALLPAKKVSTPAQPILAFSRLTAKSRIFSAS